MSCSSHFEKCVLDFMTNGLTVSMTSKKIPATLKPVDKLQISSFDEFEMSGYVVPATFI